MWTRSKRIRTLADDCIRLMSNSLKQDICGQEAPGTLVAGVERSRIEQCLPPEVSTHVSTGFSIFRRVVLSFTTTTKSISSSRYISFTGLRPLAGWEDFRRDSCNILLRGSNSVSLLYNILRRNLTNLCQG
jgi:hypothetical protein